MSYYRNPSSEFRTRRDSKWQRNQNTVTFKETVATMGPITHTVLVALMLAILGLIYLSQVTKSSSFGYEIQRQNDQLASLTAEQQDLQIENARLQALNTIKESNVAQAMTEPVSTEVAN